MSLVFGFLLTCIAIWWFAGQMSIGSRAEDSGNFFVGMIGALIGGFLFRGVDLTERGVMFSSLAIGTAILFIESHQIKNLSRTTRVIQK